MAIGFVAAVSQAGGASIPASSAIASTGGNFVGMMRDYYPGAAHSPPGDNLGNSYSQIDIQTNGVNDNQSELWYCENAVVGASHTFNANCSFGSISVSCSSGVKTSSSLDQHIAANAYNPTAVSSIQPGSLTATNANSLYLLGGGTQDGTSGISAYSVNSGFTIRASVINNPGVSQGTMIADIVSSSPLNPTISGWTSYAGAAVAFMATFKPASAPPPAAKAATLMMMGVG